MFSGIDSLLVVLYLIVIVSVGLLSRKKLNTSEYFLQTVI